MHKTTNVGLAYTQTKANETIARFRGLLRHPVS